MAPSLSLKLLSGSLHIGFCSHLLTKSPYYMPCKLPDFARIGQPSVLKNGRVPLYAIENYEQLCDFWKRIQARKHYRLTLKQLQKMSNSYGKPLMMCILMSAMHLFIPVNKIHLDNCPMWFNSEIRYLRKQLKTLLRRYT